MKVILNSKPINIFIHSVSLPLKMKGFRDLHWKDFQEHLDIQVKSFFKIVQLLIPKMKNARRGKTVNILTSATVGKPPSSMSDYLVKNTHYWDYQMHLLLNLPHLE